MKKQIKNYKWFEMGNRGLRFPVKCGSKTVIKAGTTHVGIAFGQSHLTRLDETTGQIVNMNVYRVKERDYKTGKFVIKLYHA